MNPPVMWVAVAVALLAIVLVIVAVDSRVRRAVRASGGNMVLRPRMEILLNSSESLEIIVQSCTELAASLYSNAVSDQMMFKETKVSMVGHIDCISARIPGLGSFKFRLKFIDGVRVLRVSRPMTRLFLHPVLLTSLVGVAIGEYVAALPMILLVAYFVLDGDCGLAIVRLALTRTGMLLSE